MTRYGDRINQVGPFAYEGPKCPCGNFICSPPNDPYCPRSDLFLGKRCALQGTPQDGPSSSAEFIAEFDRRALERRKEAERAGGSTTGNAGEVSPPVVAPPLKIRSKKQRRLDKADSIASVTGPDWLREEDPLLQQILESHDDR
jgi:hypothetical protein